MQRAWGSHPRVHHHLPPPTRSLFEQEAAPLSRTEVVLAAVVSIRNSTAYASRALAIPLLRVMLRSSLENQVVSVSILSALRAWTGNERTTARGSMFCTDFSTDLYLSLVPLTCHFCIIHFVFNYRYIFLFAFEHTRSLVSPVRKILVFTDRWHLPSRLSPRSLVSAALRVCQHHPSLPPHLKRQVFLRSLDSADQGRYKSMSYYRFPCPATSCWTSTKVRTISFESM